MPSSLSFKLAIDLQKIDQYFRLDHTSDGELLYKMKIDNTRYHQIEALLKKFDISDTLILHELCFILLWLETEIKVYDGGKNPSRKYNQMQTELDNLNQYLMNNRITAVNFSGEYEKNKQSEIFTLKEDINIDRICDGIRSIFQKEFDKEKTKKTNGGQSSWKMKKMSKFKNNMLKYMDSIPGLEVLSLETHLYIIGVVASLAGYYKTEEVFKTLKKISKKHESYREYLVQNVRNL